MALPDPYPIPGFSEPLSSITHLAGAGVFAVLSVPLLRRGRGSASRLACLGVFAFACVLLMAMSGVYHLLQPEGAPRAVMARLDHAAIFVLIAGTFTPIHGILFHGRWRWEPLILLWTLTAAAVTLKTVFFNDVPAWIGLSLYLGLGWLGVVTTVLVWMRYGERFARPLWAGGLAYTIGAVLDQLKWPAPIPHVLGPHEVFHLAVLVGAGLHWRLVYKIASTEVPEPGRTVEATGAPCGVALNQPEPMPQPR